MTPRLPDAVEHWSLDRLIPYARNARTHSDDQVAQIAASIIEFGWTSPILVDADGGIVAGHGRLLAARKLGLDTVPVVVLDHLTPAQRRAYVIADNKLALNAGWNEELLAADANRGFRCRIADRSRDRALLAVHGRDQARRYFARPHRLGRAQLLEQS
jgi:ParB-like chromosome segregation protein Spo0J